MFSEIALHILDILQNSLYAFATIIEINIIKPINSNEITVRICDNGSGMTKMQLRKCFDPFFTTKENKAAGLGIPFFKYAAELSGGNFSVESDKKNGTEIKAVFCTDSIDCIPVGDIFSTVYSAFISNPEIYFYVCIDINGISVNCDSEKFTNRFYENFRDISYNCPFACDFLTNYTNVKISEPYEHICTFSYVKMHRFILSGGKSYY